MTFRTIGEVIVANKAAGENWFEPKTMSWFSSRLETDLINGRYFVTSEQDNTGGAWDGQRRYTIRRANDDGSIDTVGEFGQYASTARATQAARTLEV